MEGWVNPQPGCVESGYWIWDLLHDGPLLYQLSYLGRFPNACYPFLTKLGQDYKKTDNPSYTEWFKTGSKSIYGEIMDFTESLNSSQKKKQLIFITGFIKSW